MGKRFEYIVIDTWVGMALSNIVAFFIIVTTAATLHAHGNSPLGTAADAAEALRPLAGPFAFLLFSLGIVGTELWRFRRWRDLLLMPAQRSWAGRIASGCTHSAHAVSILSSGRRRCLARLARSVR